MVTGGSTRTPEVSETADLAKRSTAEKDTQSGKSVCKSPNNKRVLGPTVRLDAAAAMISSAGQDLRKNGNRTPG